MKGKLAIAGGALVLCLGLLAPTAASATSYVIQVAGRLPADLGAQVAAAGGTLTTFHEAAGLATATSDDPAFAGRVATLAGVGSVSADQMVQWVPGPEAIRGEPLPLPESQAAGPTPQSAAFFACQWNLQQIDAPGAWAQGRFGHPGVKVAVIDSGVDPNHIDLAGHVDTANSRSALSPGSSPCGPFDENTFFDLDFHGTFVSSLITSNGLGIAAVAPETTVVAVKALNCTGSGSFGDLIDAIVYAASLPDVDVINMSLGAYFPKSATGAGPLIGALDQAVNFATRQGKLVVVAAGNNGADLDHDANFTSVPAQSGTALSVYATGITDQLASYSNHGLSGAWVGAPGGDFPNPAPPLPGCVVNPVLQSLMIGACSSFVCGSNNRYVIGAGTSFASPTVAGVAALVDGEAGGALDAAQLKTILSQSADDLGKPGADNFFSHGRVNASRAVE